jgi:hypothetical protein
MNRTYIVTIQRNEFSRYFGPKSDCHSVCSFGFKANLVHNPRLLRLQAVLRKQKWRAHIFTEIVVGTEFGNVAFYSHVT